MLTEKKITENELNETEKDYLKKIRKQINSTHSNHIEVEYAIPRKVIQILNNEKYNITTETRNTGFGNEIKKSIITW
jgi:hypothetical protein